MPTSKDDVMTKLNNIGAIHPQVFDSDVYTCSFGKNTNIIVHLIDNKYNSDTVFDVLDDDNKGRLSSQKKFTS